MRRSVRYFTIGPVHCAALRHDRQGQVIPITAGVAGLEVVAVNCNYAAIGQVAEGAADGIS